MRKRNNKGQFVKQNKKQEASFLQLSTYTSPEVKEVNGESWISYGADNDYFQFLIDRFNGSPTNSACINGVSQQIYGKGLNATDSNRRPNEYAQMVSLFKKDIVRKLCYDLKLMGQCAIQVIYSKDRSKIAEIEHMPIETLRAAKCDEDGNIPAYYYFNDWANLTNTDEPLRIPAWGMSNEDIEILYIKPYKSGFYYYSPVDYQGGLQYAELEEEVSNYHLSNVINGLAPGLLINFNNGIPNQQERQLIESRIAAKFQGSSNSGRMIVAFNDNKESQAEITPVQLSDAHNQYQFLSEECSTKVMLSHRIVSPKLLGINNGSGFGNNADEIEVASILMDNTIIRPFQELLIDNFDKILAYNDINLNLYFTTLQPLEFTEVDQTIQDKETIEEETGVEMSSDKTDLDDFMQEFGEDEDLSEWELIDERKVDYDDEQALDYQIDELNKKDKSTLSKIWEFVSTGTARPNAKSKQDEDFEGLKFKVRYQYAPLRDTISDGKDVSRSFCKEMVKAKKIYRKEDILKMDSVKLNYGWAEKGKQSSGYSIWEYKGGGACHHYWARKTYMYTPKDKRIDVKSPKAPKISVAEARRKGFRPEKNNPLVGTKPINMPNEGFVNR